MNVAQNHPNSLWLLASTLVYIAVVFAVDFLTPPSIDVWVLYLPLILLLTWLNAPRQIIIVAIVCTILMAIDIFLTQQELGYAFILVILGTRLIALWLVAISGIVIVLSVNRGRRLEHQVLEATGDEQQRIGQELHDSVGQELTGLGLMVNALADRSFQNREECKIINRVAAGIIRVQSHIRLLSHGLIPVPIDAKGLSTALNDLASDTAEQSGIVVQFSSPTAPAISNHAIATHLYRIAQEAVNNALRHARPRHITLALRQNGTNLSLSIEDDGIGIRYSADERKGLGLRMMQYRAEQIGGLLNVRPRQEGGTLVSCTLKSKSWKDSFDEQSASPLFEGKDSDS